MTSAKRALIYLVIFAVIAIGGGIFVANGIQRPVPGADQEYTAEFTNVAGLRIGAEHVPERARRDLPGPVVEVVVTPAGDVGDAAQRAAARARVRQQRDLVAEDAIGSALGVSRGDRLLCRGDRLVAWTERGLLAARHLPRYLPDWVVYDARITVERGGLLFGDRPTRAGGFFDASWR